MCFPPLCLIFAGRDQQAESRSRVSLMGIYHQRSSVKLTKAKTLVMTWNYQIIVTNGGLVCNDLFLCLKDTVSCSSHYLWVALKSRYVGLCVCNGANNGVLCTCIMDSTSIKAWIVFFVGLMMNTSVTQVIAWIKHFSFFKKKSLTYNFTHINVAAWLYKSYKCICKVHSEICVDVWTCQCGTPTKRHRARLQWRWEKHLTSQLKLDEVSGRCHVKT